MTKFLLAFLVFFSFAQSAFALSCVGASAGSYGSANSACAAIGPAFYAGPSLSSASGTSQGACYNTGNPASPSSAGWSCSGAPTSCPAGQMFDNFKTSCVPAYVGSHALQICDANGVCTGNIFPDANSACQSYGTGPIGNGAGAHIDKLSGNSCSSTQCFSNGSCTTTTYDLTSGFPVGSPSTTPPPTPASGVPTTTPTTTPSSGVPSTTPTTTPSSGVPGTAPSGGTSPAGGTVPSGGGLVPGSGTPLDLSGLDQQVTQSHIASGIDAIVNDLSTPAGSSVPDITSEAASAVNAVTALNPSVADMQGYETNIPWWSWKPSIPSLACTPFVGHILTFTITWDFCPSVQIFQDILGWLLAVFTAWELQSVIFRKVD